MSIHWLTSFHQFEKAGYSLVDQWKNKRLLEIPYHPNNTVEAYFGFYFRKQS